MSNSKNAELEFIIFGLQPWGFEMGSNCKDIAHELSKKHKVLYVNKPIERSIQIKNLFTFKKSNSSKNIDNEKILKVDNNLWILNPKIIHESINWIPHSTVYKYCNRLNAKKLAHQINLATTLLSFKNPILFIDNDFLKAFYLKDFVINSYTVFYIRDYLLSQTYFIPHGKFLEPAMICKSDLVVANSSYLSNYAKKYNQFSFDIGQGCNVESFKRESYSEPADIALIEHPRIGYCGALLTTRLDIKLIEEIAQKRRDLNFIFVGPEDSIFKNSKLHSFENVFFLGSKHVDELPFYISHFDICINPQLLNQMTIGNYPRKIDEYLAAGKPVVALKTDAMKMFSKYCYLAHDSTDFIKGIDFLLENKLSDPEIEERKLFAFNHTWENSINKMIVYLKQIINS